MAKPLSLDETLALAWQALLSEQPKMAMQYAQAALKLAPESAEVAHVLGVLASRDGKADIALPLLQKALDDGITAQKLRHMTEALLVAGHAKAALAPISDALKNFPPESETFGLLAAVQVALEQWDYAIKSAKAACELNPNTAVWQSTLSFCQLIRQNWVDGFETFTARAENLNTEGRCPTLHLSQPCDLWIKNEQGPGDTLFFARYAPHLAKLGYRLHIQTDAKTLPLLTDTKIFSSVSEKIKHRSNAPWINAGDLPLAAIQTASEPVPPPLALKLDAQKTEKIKAELAKLGPAPYIAVTWRGGPKGRKQRAGVRMYEKFIDPTALGNLLKDTPGTLISIQRLPETDEFVALCKAAGRQIVDWSALNNNLPGMLSFLSLADAYFAVPNTNVHLRESVGKASYVFLNRPFQDWRWLAEGNTSPWYPHAKVYRQSLEGNWDEALEQAKQEFKSLNLSPDKATSLSVASTIDEASIKETLWQRAIAEGWEAIDNENVNLAIKKAQEVLAEVPEHPRALHLLGWAAVTDMKFDIALAVLQKAAYLVPQDGIVWRDFIRCLTLNEQYQAAIQVADTCLANPQMRSKSGIYYALAAIHFKLGNEIKALHNYAECLKISPNNLDAIAFSGMIRMKLGTGHAQLGFKQHSARTEARRDELQNVWVCPHLKGNVVGLKVLIVRDMGLGDELSYLRYLPWLLQAGVQVDYWCGAKLENVLKRTGLAVNVIPDNKPMPDPSKYDLAFIVHELPAAVEYLGAPEIAPPLPLTPRTDLIEKWKNWLSQQGSAPYIGLNWRAGVAKQEGAASFTKLAKAIEPEKLAQTLAPVNATWISLQRNVTKMELNNFEQILSAPLHDAAGLTDDLDDLLALLSLLDANVGVSNTNMHLRAGLGLGSHVLVQNPGGDWRWGVSGNQSEWFTHSTVYRQTLEGDWSASLATLQNDLIAQFGKTTVVHKKTDSANQNIQQTKRIIWLTGGNFIQDEQGNLTSVVASTRNRVLAPAKGLENHGWISDYINESFSQTMGGWGQCIPQMGDTVVVSKVFTDHAIKLAKDAKARSAQLIVDFCDNFLDNPKRAPLQKALAELADKIVCSETTIGEAFSKIAEQPITVIENLDLDNINQDLVLSWQTLITIPFEKSTPHKNTIKQSAGNTLKRVLVGMMYSGEQEYEQAKQALQQQTHQNFELFEVKNLPNKLAHDTLYAKFMERASEFDYFLKLDADMVFAHEQVLAEMVESMAEKNYAHLFAYVKDCPSNLMIPGIQMFRSDCSWQGSDEQLNVDYLPKLKGESLHVLDKNWILHMPNPSKDQLFRYGIHKALKALQPNSVKKSQRKGMTHINILAGIARSVKEHPNLNLSLLGATLVFEGEFNSIEYTGSLTEKYLQKLNDAKFKLRLTKLSEGYWSNEIQIYYRWLDKFSQHKAIDAPTSITSREINQQTPLSKRLVWLTTGKLDASQGYITSGFASTRYRVLLPAANLGVYGWKSEIINEQELVETGWGNLKFNIGDILIVSKSLNIKTSQLIEQAKQQGCTVLVDFCDNHFERPDEIGAHFNKLLGLADLATTCSIELKTILQKKSNLPIFYITDCFEGQKSNPAFKPTETIKLLWFGNHTNLDTLDNLFIQLKQFTVKRKVQLDLVTIHPNGNQAAQNASTKNLTVNYIPWSQQNLATAMRNCDMVVIPTLKNENKSVKSPNRVIEPIWAGKYVVAGLLPAYEPFAPFASIGDDLIAGIEWAINHPQEVLEKIIAGQAYIAANHTPKLIGEKWHEVLSSVEKAEPSQTIKTNQNAQFFDSAEVSRFFTLDGIQFDNIYDAFDSRYPVKNEVKPAKKIAVFTAIFGGYDAPPNITHPDSNLDYILFADDQIKEIPAPWQLRRLPRIFADPQVDARRVKVLSHQFLPDYQASVWIDGNVSPIQLTAEYINTTLQRNPIAVCRHQFRHCIYEEAAQIVKTAKDAPAPVMRQMQFYQSIGFPQNQGLHATMFLMRDHRDSRVLKHNTRWWELLIEYSKRDQLSFDFVRWEMQTPVLTLPFNCRENTLFQWGIDASRGHVGKVRRNDESFGRAYYQSEHAQADIVQAEPYKASFDRWTKRFLLELFDLNSHLLASKQTLGSSILSRESISNTPYSLPDPRNGVLYQLLQTAVAESQKTLLIGNDTEHEILFALNHSGISLSQATFRNDELLNISVGWFNKYFSKRYTCYKVERSLFEQKILLESFDTVILSADLEFTLEEISTLILKANINTKFIALGKNVASFELSIQEHNYQGFVHPFRGIKENGIASYIKQLPVEQNDHSVDQKIYQKSVYGVWLKKRENDMTWQFAMRGNYGFYFARWIAALDKCVFLDIGANYGLYSILASQNNNIEAVHAFEPHPETFRYLTSNLNVNQSKKCNPHPFAIATIAGKQTIYADATHTGKATLRDNINPQHFSEHFDITTISNNELDELITLKPKQNVVVKIDVEGYEIEVIKTLIKSKLWQQVSHIYCEVDTSYLDEKQLLNLMKLQGFKVIHQNGAGDHYDLMFSSS